VSDEHTIENSALVRQLYSLLRAGDADGLAQVLADEFVNHNPQVPNGLRGTQQALQQVGSLDAQIFRLIAQGNLVAVHARYKGSPDRAGMDFWKIADGRIVEHWDVLEAIPADSAGHDLFSELTN
jgi:predicted SnoaL-like aldol condensation-catalyzing enzyme